MSGDHTSDSRTASFAAVFVASFAFYLALGRATLFDFVTGSLCALVVAVAFSRVAFVAPPTLRESAARLVRALVFLPYLLWEILRANVALAVVLLDPRLPIEPSIVEFDTETTNDLELTTLASAITLTPGTVVVDVQDGRLHVHALTAESLESLREGRLARAVSFVFSGGR